MIKLEFNSGNNTVKLGLTWIVDNDHVNSQQKNNFLAEKEIYLRTHSDLHVILLNLQIVPIMQNLNEHKSLHGIIGVSINNLNVNFTYLAVILLA